MSREVLKCPSCGLNQYMTATSYCRRCHDPLIVPAEPVEAVPDFFIAEHDKHPLVDLFGVFVKNVNAARQKSGLSQSQLAKRIGAPRTRISKLENHKASPTLSTLQRLADAFGVPAYVLLIPSSKPQEKTSEEVSRPHASD